MNILYTPIGYNVKIILFHLHNKKITDYRHRQPYTPFSIQCNDRPFIVLYLMHSGRLIT